VVEHLCNWKERKFFAYACKIHLTFAYAYMKKIMEIFESFVIIFVNACILSCNVGFGLLIYHTFILFFSPSQILGWKWFNLLKMKSLLMKIYVKCL
jgi:hypothetical protein